MAPVEDAVIYPGQRLGLPESGSGSVATWLSRIAALVIDWVACLLIARLIFNDAVGSGGVGEFAVFGILILEGALGTTIAGGSFGQIVMRIAVVRLDGRSVNLLQALIRMVLICLVIPPVVFNRDNRGLHDLAVGTVVIRR